MSSVRSSSGRPARRLKNEINVVPYIDVMLVLLIIFMVTAPLITPGVVKLPSVGVADSVPIPAIEVQIDIDGKASWRVRGAGQSLIPVERSALVQTILAELKEDQAVVIAADGDLLYKSVLQVLDDLRKSGISKVSLLVDQVGNDSPSKNDAQKISGNKNGSTKK